MCILCVEIIRGRITMKEGLQSFKEATDSDVTDEKFKHALEIFKADQSGDTEKVVELVKEGYRKERWL